MWRIGFSDIRLGSNSSTHMSHATHSSRVVLAEEDGWGSRGGDGMERLGDGTTKRDEGRAHKAAEPVFGFGVF